MTRSSFQRTVSFLSWACVRAAVAVNTKPAFGKWRMRQAVPKWAEVLAKYEQHAPRLFEIEYCWSKKMDWVVFEDETIISFCIIFCIDKAHHDVLTVGTCSAV